ncbi:hypothetical protein EGW08_001233 [Elysia chlorotica]|uniref:Gamma-glutamyltransferase n=1 Tax=Elysia chlorotica TaxID=188477 RepID=A0A3S1A0V9_ELYCH|nr:hypothetical protein EGW08_001233 [Elysia chlorotica]
MADNFKFASRRSVVLGRNGCVASSNPLASQIGLDILKKGGNAADAAVAVAAALNVTEPMSTGLGGDAFCMFYDNKTKTVKGLNGSGRCPQSLSLERLKSEGFDESHPLPPGHAHTVTVPGAASAWVDTVSKYGSGKLTLKEILQPAIELAENGFPVHELAAVFWEKGAGVLQWHKNVHGKEMLLNGEAPKHGDIMYNPFLANTLKELALHGKAGFYTGRVSDAIVQVVQQHGGILTPQDMATHTANEVEPISTVYRGCRVWELPPNGQGMAALIALNILEGLDLKTMGHNSVEYIHHVAESLRLAFADTLQFCADPEHAKPPLDRLLSKDYATQRRNMIRNDRVIPSSSLLTNDSDLSVGTDTVYFTATDSEGNACSFTNSNFMGFGTGLVPEGCGFTLQNRGFGFSLDPTHRNALAPGKRPYHTIIPAMVTSPDTNELLMSYGVMGGYMQPQGHVQVLLNMLEFGLDPQKALDAPRFTLGKGKENIHKPKTLLESLSLEEGIPESVKQSLATLGHNVEIVSGHERALFGRGQVISRGSSWWQFSDTGGEGGINYRGVTSKEVVYWAGSDPRADGLVAAF